jgi:uncharacterized protein VirK/YbjX
MVEVARAVHPGTSPRALWRTADLVVRQIRSGRRVQDWYGEGNPALREALTSRPMLAALVKAPYISRRWDVAQRLAVVEDHYRHLAGRAGVLRAVSRTPLHLATVMADETAVQVVVDSPAWFAHEGEVSINLFCADQRLYSLAFSLGLDAGVTTAYVGALQGCGGGSSLEIYRGLTRRLHGLRPRDLLLAAFRALCSELGVRRILAVGDRHRVCDSDYFGRVRRVATSYDAVWTEHRATGRPDGFFDLPMVAERRSREAMPSHKRAEYRKRYEMIDRLTTDIARGVHCQPTTGGYPASFWEA